jgi:phosphohistidine phosphatase
VPPAPRHVAVLLRHGQAVPAGEGDGDARRELTDRGRRQAQAAAAWLVTTGLRPDLVLCSTALRARQTWSAVEAFLAVPDVRVVEEVHRTSALALVEVLAALPEQVGTVLVVGHEPVLSGAALALAGPTSDGAALARVRAGLGTGSVAVLQQHGAWSELQADSCVLESHHASTA